MNRRDFLTRLGILVVLLFVIACTHDTQVNSHNTVYLFVPPFDSIKCYDITGIDTVIIDDTLIDIVKNGDYKYYKVCLDGAFDTKTTTLIASIIDTACVNFLRT